MIEQTNLVYDYILFHPDVKVEHEEGIDYYDYNWVLVTDTQRHSDAPLVSLLGETWVGVPKQHETLRKHNEHRKPDQSTARN